MNQFIHSDWQTVKELNVTNEGVNIEDASISMWQNMDIIMVHMSGRIVFDEGVPDVITHIDIDSPLPHPENVVKVATVMVRISKNITWKNI